MAISFGFAPWSHKEVSPSHAKRLACLNPNLMRLSLGPTNAMSKIGPTNVQEPWCLSNAASTTMITMSATMICSKRAVPSKLNSLKCKLFYFHTNCILEFWISTLLETISWVLFQVPLRRRRSRSVLQSSRSLKSSQGSERWLSDWRLGFCCCICILYLFVFVSRGVSDSSATNHVGVPSEIEQFACRLWFVKRPGY